MMIKPQVQARPQAARTINLRTASSGVGRYRVKIVETRFLHRYRRLALRLAGYADLFKDFDGSTEQYLALPVPVRQDADVHLSKLVSGNQARLNSKKARRSVVEVYARPEAENLILDAFLNRAATGESTGVNWANMSIACAVGTGTTATFVDSGATTGSTSGSSTTITISGGSFTFTSTHVGYLIRFDSGEERYIQSQTGTACEVTVAVNIVSPTAFTVWAVNQTSLVSESKRTTTYLTGAGNCGRSDAGAISTYKRTYDFSAEVSNQNYTELAWSHTGTAGANINSRTLISGGTVSVLIGQQLRVIYNLAVTWGPSTSTPGTYGITGWANTDGDYILCNPLVNAAPNINTSGSITNNGEFPLSCSSTPLVKMGTGSTLPLFGNNYSPGTESTANSSTYQSYVSGSFERTVEYLFEVANGNRTDWRAIFTAIQSFVFVFDVNQTKDDLHTLKVKVKGSWSRALTNP